MPLDIDRLIPWLERAAKSLPGFENAGIRRVVSGPITHAPDGGFLIGLAPGLDNFWMCCGAGIGITQGPGAGKYLAQWMVPGHSEVKTTARYAHLARDSVHEAGERVAVRVEGLLERDCPRLGA